MNANTVAYACAALGLMLEFWGIALLYGPLAYFGAAIAVVALLFLIGRDEEHAQDWRPFVLGYEQALKDRDQAKVWPLPSNHEARRDLAERAYRRIYIEREAKGSR